MKLILVFTFVCIAENVIFNDMRILIKFSPVGIATIYRELLKDRVLPDFLTGYTYNHKQKLF